MRDLGGGYATYLQEAGYAGGDAVFSSFREWLASRGGDADSVGFAEFQGLAAEFFRDIGWGTLEVGNLSDVVITLDSTDWAEADPSLHIGFPACYYTMGLLADFFGASPVRAGLLRGGVPIERRITLPGSCWARPR